MNYGTPPQFSEKILFNGTDSSGITNIYIVDPVENSTYNSEKIISGAYSACPSPDGSKILFEYDFVGYVNFDGTNVIGNKNLSGQAADSFDCDGAWKTDSSSFTFMHGTNNSNQVVCIDFGCGKFGTGNNISHLQPHFEPKNNSLVWPWYQSASAKVFSTPPDLGPPYFPGISIGGQVNDYEFSPDGNYFAYLSQGTIYLRTLGVQESGDPYWFDPVEKLSGGYSRIAWSSNNQTLLAGYSGNIYTINITDENPSRTKINSSNTSNNCRIGYFNEAGDKLTYHCNLGGGTTAIYINNINGTDEKKLLGQTTLMIPRPTNLEFPIWIKVN